VADTALSDIEAQYRRATIFAKSMVPIYHELLTVLAKNLTELD